MNEHLAQRFSECIRTNANAAASLFGEYPTLVYAMVGREAPVELHGIRPIRDFLCGLEGTTYELHSHRFDEAVHVVGFTARRADGEGHALAQEGELRYTAENGKLIYLEIVPPAPSLEA